MTGILPACARRDRVRAGAGCRWPPAAAVLGPAAAQRMGIDRIWPGERIVVSPSLRGGQWFYLVGILSPVPASYAASRCCGTCLRV